MMAVFAMGTAAIVLMLTVVGWRLRDIHGELAGIREELARLRKMVP